MERVLHCHQIGLIGHDLTDVLVGLRRLIDQLIDEGPDGMLTTFSWPTVPSTRRPAGR